MTQPLRDRGLTLLELVIAMSIFALVAVMGMQSIGTMLGQRDRLDALAAQTEESSQAIALLRSDMRALVPLFFHAPEGAPRSAIQWSNQRLEMSTGGRLDLPPVDALGLHRVEWQLSTDGRLMRRQWPVLTPLDASSVSPQVTWLTGVTEFSLRSYWPGSGWIKGADPAVVQNVAVGQSPLDGDNSFALASSHFDGLPSAIEITLNIGSLGRIQLVESYR